MNETCKTCNCPTETIVAHGGCPREWPTSEPGALPEHEQRPPFGTQFVVTLLCVVATVGAIAAIAALLP